MRKGQRTKKMILEKALTIFNDKGYINSSMVDVMNATGLERGGLYNHFGSRDELVTQAFNLAIEKIGAKYQETLLQKKNTRESLIDYVKVFSELYNDNPFPGGCPIMNVAIEADNSYPQLKEIAQKAMRRVHSSIQKFLENRIERGEISLGMKVDEFVTILISSLEGALMISRLYEDKAYINQVIHYLESFIHSQIHLTNGLS